MFFRGAPWHFDLNFLRRASQNSTVKRGFIAVNINSRKKVKIALVTILAFIAGILCGMLVLYYWMSLEKPVRAHKYFFSLESRTIDLHDVGLSETLGELLYPVDHPTLSVVYHPPDLQHRRVRRCY